VTSIAYNFKDDRSSQNFFDAELDRLTRICEERRGGEPITSLCLGVSGGSDSVSALLMATRWARERNISVHCVTVDHRLREESRDEAEFVGDLCRSWGVRHRILVWNRDKSAVERGKLENLAREARYRLMSEYCESSAIPALLVGHTWNDQLETFEMRKNAGSSPSGLAGMSQARSLTDRVQLLRPILHFSKSHLENFLRDKNISWKTDPMNDQEFFLRVAHRKRIKGYDENRIEAISQEIMRLGARRKEIETRAVHFLQRFCEFPQTGYATMDKDPMLTENRSVIAEILKRVIWKIGEKKYAVAISEDLSDQILCGKINTIGRCWLQVTKDKICALRENRDRGSSMRRRFRDIRKETSGGLPCLEQNHKINQEADGSFGDFANKMNLFDVFV
jgi:tRNA(Ile)-lysidine synthase